MTQTFKNISFFLMMLTVLCSRCTPDTQSSNKSTDTHDTTKEVLSHRQQISQLFESDGTLKNEVWDSLSKYNLFNPNRQALKRHEKYKVYAWHMFSSESASKYYDYSILSGVIYFSYELNPQTGGYKSIHDWKTTTLVDSAKANDCKVFLSVTNFGSKNNHSFMTNKKAQSTFISTLIKLMQMRGADGVVLDFEHISGDDSKLYSDFVALLSQKLKAQNDLYECILCLYAVDYNGVFDIPALEPHVDEYILMGYDYYGSFSKTTGPVAPLHDFIEGQNYSISSSVSSYLKKGIESKKLILGLPYYGAEWITKNKSIPSKIKDFVSSPAYYRIEEEISTTKVSRGFDHNSSSCYLIQKKKGKIYQLWYDDSTSIGLKFDWAKYNQLGGVAPWVFSYAGGSTGLWTVLRNKFSAPQQDTSISNVVIDPASISESHKFLTRANTKDYFRNNKDYMAALSKNYKPWEYQKSALKTGAISFTYQVYGFYPYWNDAKGLKLDFTEYTRIGYYAALPDHKTGKIMNAFNWDSLDVNIAHRYGCKVDLVVAGYNEAENSTLFSKSKSYQTLVTEILKLIKQSNGDGVTLDFGHFKEKDKANFTSFVEQLSKGLKAIDKDMKLNCMLPPILTAKNKYFAYDFENLDPLIDYFILSGFDYYGRNSKTAGPNAPLLSSTQWGDFSIEASGSGYVSLGVPLDKLILVVPYFGKQWETESTSIPSKTKGKLEFLSYQDFKTTSLAKATRVFDSASSTPCYSMNQDNKNLQVWIDDSVSLAMKYDYILKYKLAGVGVWAIGYDGNDEALQALLLDKFTVGTGGGDSSKGSVIQKITRFFTNIKDIEMVLWVINIFLIFCMLLLVILSFKVCLIRSLLNRFLYFFYGLGFILFILTYFLIRQSDETPDDGTLALALFIVIVCLVWIKRMHDNSERKMYP